LKPINRISSITCNREQISAFVRKTASIKRIDYIECTPWNLKLLASSSKAAAEGHPLSCRQAGFSTIYLKRIFSFSNLSSSFTVFHNRQWQIASFEEIVIGIGKYLDGWVK
jgi:hypothetical protein